MMSTMSRLLLLLAALALVFCVRPASAKEVQLPADVQLALAITDPTVSPPSTKIFTLNLLTGVTQTIYGDSSDQTSRLLVRIAGSDLLQAARTVPPRDIYTMRGPARVEPGAPCEDTLSRLRVGEGARWEPRLLVPLCFSDASPYGLWNRAPLFAVSPDGKRVAFPALRAGEEKFPRLTIRVLSLTGGPERRLALPEGGWFAVTDLAWSPNGAQFVYSVIPEGDEHTLDESLLPKAGVYLADVQTEVSLLLHRCYADALSWSPVTGLITVAIRPGDIWAPANVLRVIDPFEGARREEMSAAGSVQALAHSDNGKWLSAQTMQRDGEHIYVYPVADGFAQEVFHLPTGEGRLALIGWLRIPGPGA